MNNFFGKKSPETVVTKDASGQVISTGAIPGFSLRPETLDEGALYNPIPQQLAPMWPLDSTLDITIVVSPSFNHEPLASVPKERKVLEEKGFKFGSYNEKRAVDTDFAVPKDVQNNGTLWGHFYIGLEGSNLDPAIGGFDPAKGMLNVFVGESEQALTSHGSVPFHSSFDAVYCSKEGGEDEEPALSHR